MFKLPATMLSHQAERAGAAGGTAVSRDMTLPQTTTRPKSRELAVPKVLRDNAAGYFFLLPWLVGFFVLTLGPLLASLYLSFTNFDLLTPPDWIGAANYVEMFTQDRRFRTSLSVTFRYVVFSVPLALAFALLVAMLLNRNIRGIGLYRATFYLPSLLGGSVAIAILWRQIFGKEGLINQVLALVGITGPSWISTPAHALDTLIVLHIWQFGSAMLIFLAGLKQIPQDLYDAASVDGAGPVSKFFRITLPMLTPVLFFNLIMGIIGAFKAFTSAYIISNGNGGPLDSTLFYTLYLYQKGFTDFEMGYASAMAWVLLAIIAACTALVFRSSRFWVHYES
jgi:multiple sugar transport system permease protein